MKLSPEANDLAETLRGRGITLESGGDMIYYRPRRLMTPALLEQLRTHKPELQAWLLIQQAEALGDDDVAEAMTEAWDERLSIQSEKNGAVTADQLQDGLAQLRAMLIRPKLLDVTDSIR